VGGQRHGPVSLPHYPLYMRLGEPQGGSFEGKEQLKVMPFYTMKARGEVDVYSMHSLPGQ